VLLTPPIPFCLNSAPLLLLPPMAESMVQWSWQFPVHISVTFTAAHEYVPDGGFTMVDCRCFQHHQFPCASTVHLCYCHPPWLSPWHNGPGSFLCMYQCHSQLLMNTNEMAASFWQIVIASMTPNSLTPRQCTSVTIVIHQG